MRWLAIRDWGIHRWVGHLSVLDLDIDLDIYWVKGGSSVLVSSVGADIWVEFLYMLAMGYTIFAFCDVD